MTLARDLFRNLDLACSAAVLFFGLGACLLYAVVEARRAAEDAPPVSGRRTALPPWTFRALMWLLLPAARLLLTWGVSANAITGASLLLGAVAGVLLGVGHFGVAALVFVVASIGDALDGLVARTGHTESHGGALFDASVDRYAEFFAFGGLAYFFRASAVVFTLTLAALMGSLMVSYGSAKAEARHVPVPGGAMRRPERAACLGLGLLLAPFVATASVHAAGPAWAGTLPVVVAVLVIAIAANVSAIRRLRAIARTPTPASIDRVAPAAETSVARASAG